MDSNKDNEGVDKTEPTVTMNFTEVKKENSFGRWFSENALDLTVYAVTAVILGGMVWLAYESVKQELDAQEMLAENAKKNIKLVTEAYSRGAKVLAGPGNTNWIIEGDKVELIY